MANGPTDRKLSQKDQREREPDHITPLGMAALEARVSQDAIHSFNRGDVIKHADVDDAALLVVGSGRIAIERDIKTSSGVRTVTTDVFHKGDPLNYGRDFAKISDAQNRYVAETDDTRVIVLSKEVFDQDRPLFERTKRMFLSAITRHGAGLRDDLVQARAEAYEANRKLNAFEADEFDGLDIGQNLEIEQLKDQNERLKEKIRQLLPIAEQKGREATAQLKEDERIALALVNLSNYFFSLVARELTPPEVEKARQLIHDVHPRWSEAEMTQVARTLLQPPSLFPPPTVREAPMAKRQGPPPLPIQPARHAIVPPPLPTKAPITVPPPKAITDQDSPSIEFEEVQDRQTLDWTEIPPPAQEISRAVSEHRDTLVYGLKPVKK